MKYIDIHSHLNFPEYDSDRELVIDRAQKEGIAIINVGTDIPTSKSALDLAKKYPEMWATVGIHPTEAKEEFDFEKITELCSDSKVVAIGECGLDYLRSQPNEIDRQKEVFIKHIELANVIKKPLMLHVRNGKENQNAYSDAVDILKEYAKVSFNFHFFAGNAVDLKNILDIGGNVSFTGVITFAREYDEIIRNVPSDRILSETDSPFVAPVPNRGKRNEPLFVKDVVNSLVSIRNEDSATFTSQLIDNAKRLFSI